MIAKLTGILESAGDDWAVVDVGGIGYLVRCSARTLRAMPARGEAVRVHVETHIRDDRILLYGFADTTERDWFTLLQTVQGVGARVALGILSVLGPGELAQAIAARDRGQLTRANGVGARLAGRIVSEMKEQVANLALGPGAPTGNGAAGAGVLDGAAGEAVSALVNLGYRRAEAYGAVTAAGRALGSDAGVEALIRTSLQELAS